MDGSVPVFYLDLLVTCVLWCVVVMLRACSCQWRVVFNMRLHSGVLVLANTMEAHTSQCFIPVIRMYDIWYELFYHIAINCMVMHFGRQRVCIPTCI